MKTSLEHLPLEKQQLIQKITGVIVEKIRPEKVILYGSYATGKWVEDEYYEGHILMEYKSDIDFLVITKTGDRRTDEEVQEIVEKRSGLREEVSAITHDMEYVNGRLSEGQYFFADIQKEGIMLYDAGTEGLAARRKLTAGEKKVMAQDDYDHWFDSAQAFVGGTRFYINQGQLNIASFELHQAAERTFNTVILVFRGYKPKTHNLGKLRRYANHFSRELYEVFPNNSPEEKYIFDLLKKGYVDARYKKKYKITLEELNALILRVEKLQEVTARICLEKIASFETESE